MYQQWIAQEQARLRVEGAVEVDDEGVDVAIVADVALNSDSVSCELRPRILACWLAESMCDFTAFTPIHVICIVFLQTLQ